MGATLGDTHGLLALQAVITRGGLGGPCEMPGIKSESASALPTVLFIFLTPDLVFCLGNAWLCVGLIPGSALNDRSWLGLGTI